MFASLVKRLALEEERVLPWMMASIVFWLDLLNRESLIRGMRDFKLSRRCGLFNRARFMKSFFSIVVLAGGLPWRRSPT